jgi:hypothetical protein
MIEADDLAVGRAALVRGLSWLSSAQPDSAVAPGLSFALNKRLTMLVLVRVGTAHRPAVGFTSLSPLTIGEVGQLRTLVESIIRVAGTWNGAGFHNFGLEIDASPGPSVVACLERFRDGCPKHRLGSWCKDCTWLGAGVTNIVAPTGWKALRTL